MFMKSEGTLAEVAFIENDRSLIIKIKDYESPYGYDPENWLELEIVYIVGNKEHIYHDSCLRSIELEEICDGIREVLEGINQGKVIETLEMEIEFKFAAYGQYYMAGVNYYTGDEFDEITLTQNMSREKMVELYNSFQELKHKYPVKQRKECNN